MRKEENPVPLLAEQRPNPKQELKEPVTPKKSPTDNPAPNKSSRAAARRLERVLELIEEVARHCQEVEREFGTNPPPELETVLKFHRVLLMHYCLEAKEKPEVLREIRELIRPVLDWAALQEKRKQRKLAEQKYHDAAEARKAQNAQAGDRGALRQETLELIEQELNLL